MTKLKEEEELEIVTGVKGKPLFKTPEDYDKFRTSFREAMGAGNDIKVPRDPLRNQPLGSVSFLLNL